MMARPGRTAAVVGAVVAVSATTLMGVLAGTASAVAPGRCTENVNVRAEPSTASRIVALCEAGTAVETGRTRDGFVQITDLGGWAAQEYISVDGAAPASGSPRSASPSSSETSSPRTTTPAPSRSREAGSSETRSTGSTEPTTTRPSATPQPRSSDSSTGGDRDDTAGTGSSAGSPAEDEAGGGSGLGGLLG